MKRILITSGPTREYLDPVRYLTNASSGRMGAALSRAALDAGFDVTIVTGPVAISYPSEAHVVRVVSTAEMLRKAAAVFPKCVGVIGVAAPCDFTPVKRSPVKMTKDDLTRGENPAARNGLSGTFTLELVETPDILAALGAMKKPWQWSIAFALETDDRHQRAMAKRIKKNADFIALNRPAAIGGIHTSIELFDVDGLVETLVGDKPSVAQRLISMITQYNKIDTAE